VQRGANQHASVNIWKSVEGEPLVADKTELEKALDELASAKADLTKAESEIATLKSTVSELQADIRAKERTEQDLRRDLDVEKAKNADPEEEILKGMSEAAKTQYLAQKEQMIRLQKRLDKEEEQRALAEIAKSFSADFPMLPTSGEDFAPIMKVASATFTDEQVETLRAVLKAGNDALDTLTKLNGRIGGVEKTSAEAEIERLARERVSSGNVTYEQAFTKVLSENPNLYAKYLSEQNGRQ